MSNYYQILGLSQDAAETAIERTWIKKSFATHPDFKGGNRQMFQAVQLAYQVLINPVERKLYDAFLKSTTPAVKKDEKFSLLNAFRKNKSDKKPQPVISYDKYDALYVYSFLGPDSDSKQAILPTTADNFQIKTIDVDTIGRVKCQLWNGQDISMTKKSNALVFVLDVCHQANWQHTVKLLDYYQKIEEYQQKPFAFVIAQHSKKDAVIEKEQVDALIKQFSVKHSVTIDLDASAEQQSSAMNGFFQQLSISAHQRILDDSKEVLSKDDDYTYTGFGVGLNSNN